MNVVMTSDPAGSSRCRARPRGCRSAGPSSTTCWAWPSTGSPRSSTPRPTCWPRRRRPALVASAAGAGHGQPRQGGGDGRRCWRAFEVVPRPADLPEVEETADTLEGNARLKARGGGGGHGGAAVADDTGLEVDALGGRPGVYVGPLRRPRRHLRRQRGQAAGGAGRRAGRADRTARFRTVAVALLPRRPGGGGRGRGRGTIADGAGRATDGFGYDPVFVPAGGDGRTFAEMTRPRRRPCPTGAAPCGPWPPRC